MPVDEVQAFGSKVKETADDVFDLDLAVRNPSPLDDACFGIGSLRTDLTAGVQPIRTEVVDWSRIREAFRREILKAHLVP